MGDASEPLHQIIGDSGRKAQETILYAGIHWRILALWVKQ